MDTETIRETKMIRVTVEAWNKAKKMAALRKVKERGDAEIGAVATDAIQESWEKLPQEVRDFLESEPAESETKAA